MVTVLTVMGMNSSASFVEHPKNTTAFENDTITLICHFDKPVDCSWLKCGNPYSIHYRTEYISQNGFNTKDCSIRIKCIQHIDCTCDWVCESKSTAGNLGQKSNKAWITLITKDSAPHTTIAAEMLAEVSMIQVTHKTQKLQQDSAKDTTTETTTLPTKVPTTHVTPEPKVSQQDWAREFPTPVILSSAISGGLLTLVFIAAIIGFACYKCSKSKVQQQVMPGVIGGMPFSTVPPGIPYSHMCRHSMIVASPSTQPCEDSSGYMLPMNCMNKGVVPRPHGIKDTHFERSSCKSTPSHFYEEIHDSCA